MSATAAKQQIRILFVCLGNICRSPTAEGILRAELERRGHHERVEVDSAGTGGWHVGDAADPRMRRADLRLFASFLPPGAPQDVPDPYYGGPDGFDRVIDLIEEAAAAIADHLVDADGEEGAAAKGLD